MEIDTSDEELFLFQILLEEEEKTEKKKRKHKMWVHDICRERKLYGEFHHLIPDLKKDPTKFFEYFRMSEEKFEELLHILNNDLIKQKSKFREPVEPYERLAVCLRFLATGNSFRSLAFSFRLGEKTVRAIVYETCTAIWQRMKIDTPSEEQWETIACQFWDKWNFPNCIGSLDGKQVVIECLAKSGSKFFGYKKTFCVVLLALVGADYKFLVVDIGGLGKNSDGNIFSNSNFGKALAENRLNIPHDKPLPGTEDAMPHVIIGDAAFPLGRHLMRPYPGNQTLASEEKKVFNYRLSRARRVSENAFGILCRRFRIYERRLSMTPEHINIVVAATCCLHNFLITNVGLQDDLKENNETLEGLVNLPHFGGNATQLALSIRDKFKQYFVSNFGSLPWQLQVVRRGFRHHE
ncbi:uncharacterized protein LOC126739132 [Anthonomus grandis grandis]|uniref:uncharacterized protein LOC126739132 n=1 Tax=Anthonomus grandis grandis TaxID=2921223 RepID=UPI0021661829|nr:uncharacterized protein LOC126739132 [Anthonomus grandis grandis]